MASEIEGVLRQGFGIAAPAGIVEEILGPMLPGPGPRESAHLG